MTIEQYVAKIKSQIHVIILGPLLSMMPLPWPVTFHMARLLFPFSNDLVYAFSAANFGGAI